MHVHPFQLVFAIIFNSYKCSIKSPNKQPEVTITPVSSGVGTSKFSWLRMFHQSVRVVELTRHTPKKILTYAPPAKTKFHLPTIGFAERTVSFRRSITFMIPKTCLKRIHHTTHHFFGGRPLERWHCGSWWRSRWNLKLSQERWWNCHDIGEI